MSKTTRLILVAAVVAAGVGVAGTASTVGRESAPDVRLATTTAAEVTDGSAYVVEAIENLRVSETFRFTQVLTTSTAAADPGTGTVTGVVDLAVIANEAPRYLSRLALKRPDGEAVDLESIAIGEDVHVKGPKQEHFQKSDKKARRSNGKKPGGGAGAVHVIDPVLQLLEPVSVLPAAAFSLPTEIAADGTRTVFVTLPASSALTIFINDATRQIVRFEFQNGPKSAVFTLADVGSTSLEVPDPS